MSAVTLSQGCRHPFWEMSDQRNETSEGSLKNIFCKVQNSQERGEILCNVEVVKGSRSEGTLLGDLIELVAMIGMIAIFPILLPLAPVIVPIYVGYKVLEAIGEACAKAVEVVIAAVQVVAIAISFMVLAPFAMLVFSFLAPTILIAVVALTLGFILSPVFMLGYVISQIASALLN